MWNLPGSGTEPVSPALAGGLLTAELPGMPPKLESLRNKIYVKRIYMKKMDEQMKRWGVSVEKWKL